MQLPFPSGYSQAYLACCSHAQCWGNPWNCRGDETGFTQSMQKPRASVGLPGDTPEAWQGVPDGGCGWGRLLPGCCSLTELREAAERRKSLFPRAEPQPAPPCSLAPLSFPSRQCQCPGKALLGILLAPTPQNLLQGARTVSVGAAASPKARGCSSPGAGQPGQARLPRQGWNCHEFQPCPNWDWVKGDTARAAAPAFPPHRGRDPEALWGRQG